MGVLIFRLKIVTSIFNEIRSLKRQIQTQRRLQPPAYPAFIASPSKASLSRASERQQIQDRFQSVLLDHRECFVVDCDRCLRTICRFAKIVRLRRLLRPSSPITLRWVQSDALEVKCDALLIDAQIQVLSYARKTPLR